MPVSICIALCPRTALPQPQNWHQGGGMWSGRGGARETPHPERGVLPVLSDSPPHPGPPAPGRRFGAMHEDDQANGKVTCRGAVRVPREGRPPAGLAVRGRNPGPLQLQWQQEASPVHLLPPGLQGSDCRRWAAFCSALPWGRALSGGWTKGARVSLPSLLPLFLCLAAWLGPLPAEPPFLSGSSG